MRYLYNHRQKPIATLIGFTDNKGEHMVHINFFGGSVSFNDTVVPLDDLTEYKQSRQLFEVNDMNDEQKQMDIFDI